MDATLGEPRTPHCTGAEAGREVRAIAARRGFPLHRSPTGDAVGVLVKDCVLVAVDDADWVRDVVDVFDTAVVVLVAVAVTARREGHRGWRVKARPADTSPTPSHPHSPDRVAVAVPHTTPYVPTGTHELVFMRMAPELSLKSGGFVTHVPEVAPTIQETLCALLL